MFHTQRAAGRATAVISLSLIFAGVTLATAYAQTTQHNQSDLEFLSERAGRSVAQLAELESNIEEMWNRLDDLEANLAYAEYSDDAEGGYEETYYDEEPYEEETQSGREKKGGLLSSLTGGEKPLRALGGFLKRKGTAAAKKKAKELAKQKLAEMKRGKPLTAERINAARERIAGLEIDLETERELILSDEAARVAQKSPGAGGNAGYQSDADGGGRKLSKKEKRRAKKAAKKARKRAEEADKKNAARLTALAERTSAIDREVRVMERLAARQSN